MILAKCFEKEWIENRSTYFKRSRVKADPELIEKVIHALHLLEALSKINIEFVFKGGTSLLLLLNKIHRFSIDIDVIIDPKTKADLEAKLENIVSISSAFFKYEKQQRETKLNVPKDHYKFFYTSKIDHTERYILLDILFEENPYSNLVERDIICDFIESDGDITKVCIPSRECILGDKLTAFAPNTTGIPYNKGKELEIIKQLFDVSNLFDEFTDLSIVTENFKKIASQEINYRDRNDITYTDVLDDMFKTSINLASRGYLNETNFKDLEDGVKKIKSYIFSGNFIIENAIECSGKVAYLASAIKNNISALELHNENIDITKLTFSSPVYSKKFKGIKKFSSSGYYYLYKALELNPID